MRRLVYMGLYLKNPGYAKFALKKGTRSSNKILEDRLTFKSEEK